MKKTRLERFLSTPPDLRIRKPNPAKDHFCCTCFYPCSSVCIRGSKGLVQCLSVFITGRNRICQRTARMLYMWSTCRRPFWNLRDAKIESLAPAAYASSDGNHEPHAKTSEHIRCSYFGETFRRQRTLGRADPEENDARRKNRTGLRRVGLRRIHVHREPRVSRSSPRRRRKTHWLLRNSNARVAAGYRSQPSVPDRRNGEHATESCQGSPAGCRGF